MYIIFKNNVKVILKRKIELFLKLSVFGNYTGWEHFLKIKKNTKFHPYKWKTKKAYSEFEQMKGNKKHQKCI